MWHRVIIFILALTTVAGCANVQPVLAPNVTADENAGYVAGQFSRMKGRGYGFMVRAVEGEAEYILPLGEDTNWPTELHDQTVAIKLPPGTYTVTQWITYATLTKEIMSRKALTGTALNQPFTVKSGSVIHLGSYDVSQYTTIGFLATTTHMQIKPRRVTQVDVQKAFSATYPNLAKQPFYCVLCMDIVRLEPLPRLHF